MIGIMRRRQVGQPCVSVRLAGSFPKPLVAYAQAPAGTAVTAARDGTDREFLAPESDRGRGRDEHFDVRPAFLLPARSSGPCRALGCAVGGRTRHPAGRGVEYQRPTLGNEDVHAELRSDGGHQLAQQPRSRGGSSGRSAAVTTAPPARSGSRPPPEPGGRPRRTDARKCPSWSRSMSARAKY